MINEQMSKLLVFLRESLIRSFAHKKRVIHSKNLTKIVFFGMFFCKFFNKEQAICSFPHLKEQYERIAQVAHQK